MSRTFFATVVAIFFAAVSAFVNNGIDRINFEKNCIITEIMSFLISISGAARSMIKASALSMKMDISKFAAIVPAMVAAPAFASVDVRFNLD
jgi:hypothetical protein